MKMIFEMIRNPRSFYLTSIRDKWGVRYGLCASGVQAWFDVPEQVTKIWVTVSDAPLPRGYKGRVTYNHGGHCVHLRTSAGEWVHTGSLSDEAVLMKELFGDKEWYVNVEYEG